MFLPCRGKLYGLPGAVVKIGVLPKRIVAFIELPFSPDDRQLRCILDDCFGMSKSSMLQSWGTSTLSHDASLYSGRSAPVISPAQKRQAVSND